MYGVMTLGRTATVHGSMGGGVKSILTMQRTMGCLESDPRSLRDVESPHCLLGEARRLMAPDFTSDRGTATLSNLLGLKKGKCA